MPSPLVSIVIPVRNYERYVGAAIESVLEQTFRDWELIIVDDFSTDGTPGVISKYANEDRVRLLRNETNLGQFPTHNRGAEHARGKYIKFFHGDDIMYPHCLEMMISLMEAFPEAGLGVSHPPSPWVAPHRFLPREAWRAELGGQTGMLSEGPSGTIFRTEAFRELGGYDSHFTSGDVEMNFRTAMHYSVLLLPSGLWWYRKHDQQVSRWRATEAGRVHRAIETFKWHRELLFDRSNPLLPRELKNARYCASRDFARLVLFYLRHGRAGPAIELLRQSRLPISAMGYAFIPKRLPAQVPVAAAKNWKHFAKFSVRQSRSSAPLTSVLIPLHHDHGGLAETIESVVAQRFSEWELIIIGDSKTQRSNQIASSYAANRKISYFYNGSAGVQWANHKDCVKRANGKYLKFLHPGDLLYPHALRIMVSLMEYYGDAGLGVACEVGPYREAARLTPLQVMRAEFFATPMLDCSLSSTIIRKDAFDVVRGIEPQFPPCDRHLQLKLADQEPVLRLCRGLVICDSNKGPNSSLCGTWPRGWAEGCEWLVPWVLREAKSMPLEERRIAATNVLKYLWEGGSALGGRLPKMRRNDHQKLAVRLAEESGISTKLLTQRPRGNHGWSQEMQEEERQISVTPPDIKSFLTL